MHEQGAFISYLNEATSALDDVDAMRRLQERQAVITRSISSHQVQAVATVFGVALLVPSEYLTQVCRTELVRRAIAADAFISSLVLSENQDTIHSQSLVTLRIFVRRTVADTSLGLDHLTKPRIAMSHAIPNRPISFPEYVEHLLNGNDGFRPTSEYMSSTLDLIEECFACVRSANFVEIRI
jgi:hypothetical protein